MKYVLGADPGKSGAIALIKTTAKQGAIKASDVVMIPTKVSGGKIDTARIIETLKGYAGHIGLAVQERVHAIFGSSAISTFEFGDANGALRATIETLLMTSDNENPFVQVVMPAVWQKTVWADSDIVADPVLDKTTKAPKVLKSGKIRMKVDTKATSMNAAHRLFPEVSFVMPRCQREHDGCIDAALIAYYALRKWQA